MCKLGDHNVIADENYSYLQDYLIKNTGRTEGADSLFFIDDSYFEAEQVFFANWNLFALLADDSQTFFNFLSQRVGL